MAKTFNLMAIILVLSMLTGCGSQSSNGYVMPQQINEPAISLLPPTFEQQTEIINNCDGASPSYVVRYKTVESQNATFEVIVEAGGLVTGTPIPTALEVQLEAKIAASLSKQYGITVERDHELPLVIPTGKKVQHVITWKITRIKGIIDVLYDNGTAQVAFNKIANVELYDRQSTDLSCDQGAMLFTPQYPTAVPQNIQDIPTSTVVVIGTTPPPQSAPLQSAVQPIREHYAVDVGDGVFDNATFSDGKAEYSESWLWDNSHFDIQRIRQEEQPSGCDISRYNTDLVWVSATTGVYITINGKNVGTYTAADDPHGYILKMKVGMGDKICAVNFTRVGFSIVMGPDIYYHYDSYCYRGNCNK